MYRGHTFLFLPQFQKSSPQHGLWRFGILFIVHFLALILIFKKYCIKKKSIALTYYLS